MPIPVNVANYIEFGKIGSFLAANDENNFVKNPGGTLIPNLSRLIYITTQAIIWKYAYAPTDPSLTYTANYLYALVASYVQQAQIIMGAAGGAFIIPTGALFGLAWEDVDFEVPNVLLADGGVTITLAYENIIVNSIDLYKNQAILFTNLPVAQDYSVVYTAASAVITLTQQAQTSDTFRIRFVRRTAS